MPCLCDICSTSIISIYGKAVEIFLTSQVINVRTVTVPYTRDAKIMGCYKLVNSIGQTYCWHFTLLRVFQNLTTSPFYPITKKLQGLTFADVIVLEEAYAVLKGISITKRDGTNVKDVWTGTIFLSWFTNMFRGGMR